MKGCICIITVMSRAPSSSKEPICSTITCASVHAEGDQCRDHYRPHGGSLVFIFPLATMLTLPDAVRTQMLRGYCNITHCCKSHHKTAARLSSNSTISFLRKPTRKDPLVKSDQNKTISVHVLRGSFRHRSAPVL